MQALVKCSEDKDVSGGLLFSNIDRDWMPRLHLNFKEFQKQSDRTELKHTIHAKFWKLEQL